MPFPDGAFDAVYIFEAGCHMPDKARFYVECARVLRPGGVFLGNDWLQRDGLTASEAAQHIEPICRTFAMRHLATLTGSSASRRRRVCCGSDRGRVRARQHHRNWEPSTPEHERVPELRALAGDDDDEVLHSFAPSPPPPGAS